MLSKALMMFIGFCGGVVVAGGVFALITALGIVPRMIDKTNTRNSISLYENCIIFGGIGGTIASLWQVYLPVGSLGLMIIGLANGIFIGNLLVALAEFINVLPIINRRSNLVDATAFTIVFLGLGKSIGSLIYFLVSAFNK